MCRFVTAALAAPETGRAEHANMRNRDAPGGRQMTTDGKSGPPIDRSGVRPEVRALLETIDLMPPPPIEQQTPASRRALAQMTLPSFWGPREDVASIEDIAIPVRDGSVKARLYRPGEAKGTVLFLHGGGWMVGNLDTHDAPCRMLANRTPCDIVSVEYRKAPEHPFPAAVNDVDDALAWLVDNGASIGLDTRQVIVVGESAGANLAAVLARHARDRHIALAGQVLIYPATDMSLDSQSYRDFAKGFFLTAESVAWFLEHYFADPSHRFHADAAPLRAADLRRLAPAFVVTAEFDPLRDEGRAYAARLIEAGNDVAYVEWKGVVHGFLLMNSVTTTTAELVSATAAWIRGRWAHPT